MRPPRAHRGESGIGLVELVVGLAITGMILSTTGLTLVSMLRTTTQGQDQLSATHQLRTAFFWLNHDTQSAVSAQAVVAPGDVTLQWTDHSTSTAYMSRFQQVGAELQRTITVGGVPATIVVARNVVPGGFAAIQSGDSITYTLTVTEGSGTKSRSETVTMRVSDAPLTPFPTVTPSPTPTFTPSNTPTFTPTATPTYSGPWFVSGSYTGNGADNRDITGVGFQPDIVIIKYDNNTAGVIRTSAMSGDAAKLITSNAALAANYIQSFAPDGFQVGSNANVNQSGRLYHWVAMRASSHVQVGTYTGNGADNRNITGVGFSPDWVITLANGEQDVFRPGPVSGDASYLMNGSNSITNRIQSLLADGFQVGSDNDVNQNTRAYYWIAFNDTSETEVGSYTGDSADNRNVSSLGITPQMVWVKRLGARQSVWRTDTVVGDRSLYWGASASVADRIQSIVTGGFQVGTDQDVNQNNQTYYYLALHDQALPTATPTPTDTATPTATPTNTPTPTPTATFTPTNTPTNTPTPTPTNTPVPGAAWFATGSYTGNGLDDRNVTGVGFQPDIVIVKYDDNTRAVLRTANMPSDRAKLLTSNNSLAGNTIQAFLADGFQIGNDNDVNQSGRLFHWVAIKAGANASYGSYTGDAVDNRNITGLGFQPDWLLTIADGEQDFFRPGILAGDNSFQLDAGNPSSNRIQALLGDGFQLGNNNDVNQSGRTYYWVAFNASADVEVGSYTGNSADNRNIATGVTPSFLWIKRSASREAVWRTSTVSGDRSLYWGITAAAVDRIQSLSAAAFQVGTNQDANQNSQTYYYLAVQP